MDNIRNIKPVSVLKSKVLVIVRTQVRTVDQIVLVALALLEQYLLQGCKQILKTSADDMRPV